MRGAIILGPESAPRRVERAMLDVGHEHLAMRPSEAENRAQGPWTVTHLPTGRAVYFGWSRAEAAAYVAMVGEACWSFLDAGDTEAAGARRADGEARAMLRLCRDLAAHSTLEQMAEVA